MGMKIKISLWKLKPESREKFKKAEMHLVE